ncbi:hypothetical protein [Streptomyces sp. 8L]|uniref:hypothetical protein n=1 Tax=Streptomyces sp. 8L TaxID=2877242 RepID=UPI001CD7122A|nr:hypothetical protein [Streptomyces sp. 8L]MCA1223528.1 hypothetical protein [Streptomyces sp. 8L]
MLAIAHGDHDAALRYLGQLAERASAAKTGSAVAEVLSEIAAPTGGLLHLTRDVLVRAWNTARDLQGSAPGTEPEAFVQVGQTTGLMSQAAHAMLCARNHAARVSQPAAPTPQASIPQPAASRHR